MYLFVIMSIVDGDNNPRILGVDHGRFDDLDSARSYARSLAFDYHVDWGLPIRVSFMVVPPSSEPLSAFTWDEYCPIF